MASNNFMERISVFDIFKIGIGPSSSHTMGPWKAANRFLLELTERGTFEKTEAVQVELYGSLAKTGMGHGTDLAVILGLQGTDPSTVAPELVKDGVERVKKEKRLMLDLRHPVPFDYDHDLIFHYEQSLPYHANGMIFRAFYSDGTTESFEYYSVGGGFVVKKGEEQRHSEIYMPYPIDTAAQLKSYCDEQAARISEVVMKNELALRDASAIRSGLLNIWNTMKASIYKSCHTDGILPGGLQVQRRAHGIANRLLKNEFHADVGAWMNAVRRSPKSFDNTLKWLSCFALAVNEENADYGRIVTAPTNGAAGVIPAVLMYHLCFNEHAGDDDVIRFLLTAGEIGSLFKKGATISAAMGGCQAEIGVSSAMAAAGLAECLGADPDTVMMAAEIAMEHHLGMTCDPIGGLVQIPCIERNTMGAIKAVTACHIALETDPSKALVSLDAVIKTMMETAIDMNTKYKETSDGGLAVHIPVNVVEC
ncbi:MAG TPA: L-serine ammonia-lyase [Saprospiraceae bacterium]|nr:L-serine ammonia-lyase [Saprospiraceae bacterium]